MNTEKVIIGSLQPGDRIEFGRINSAPLIWLIGEKNHKGFPDDSVNIVTEDTIGNMTFSPANPIDTIMKRRLYGNNRYSMSLARTYLNSDTFLHTVFTDEDIAAILRTDVKTKVLEIDKGRLDTCHDHLFLLSASEVCLEEEDEEGSAIELFKNREMLKVRDINGDHDWWWLRSALMSNPFHVRNVDSVGRADSNAACNGNRGLRPACNLAANYQVSLIRGGNR